MTDNINKSPARTGYSINYHKQKFAFYTKNHHSESYSL